jgi:hypothetical protein
MISLGLAFLICELFMITSNRHAVDSVKHIQRQITYAANDLTRAKLSKREIPFAFVFNCPLTAARSLISRRYLLFDINHVESYITASFSLFLSLSLSLSLSSRMLIICKDTLTY